MKSYFSQEQGKATIGNVFGLIVILFLFFGPLWEPITSGVEKTRANDEVETFLVTTTAGTAANVTLSYDLYQGKTAKVKSVISSNSTDTPVAYSYFEDDKNLEIVGLRPNISRNIIVSYSGETENIGWRTIGPWLTIGIVCFVGYLLWSIFLKK
jgi:hypothetical protein